MANSTSLDVKSIPWLTKLGFWFIWTLAHALGGAFGLLMGEIVIRLKIFGDSSLTAGFVLFEGILMLVKHIVFRFFKEMRYVQAIDNWTWIGAGIAVLVGYLAGEGMEGEGITTISLNLLRGYGFLVNGYLLTSQVPRIFNSQANQTRKLWLVRLKQNLKEQPLLKLISVPFLVLTAILLYVIILFLIAASWFIVLSPIEYFKMVSEDLPGLTKVIVFGFTAVGWIGCLSGLAYIFSFPKGLILLASVFKPKRD